MGLKYLSFRRVRGHHKDSVLHDNSKKDVCAIRRRKDTILAAKFQLAKGSHDRRRPGLFIVIIEALLYSLT
ncbi:MAG: hypothetical protein VX264_02205, partial [Chloroflexota bacterium]|nr:hypothetical protein [Chloroflexota bacterium]